MLKLITLKSIGYIFECVFLLILAGCTMEHPLDHSVTQDISKVPQNTLAFLPPNASQPIAPRTAQKLAQNYINKFFAPWETPFIWQSPNFIKRESLAVTRSMARHPGWNQYQNLNTSYWATQIARNANLASYPNFKRRAITIHATNLRLLPTNMRSFGGLCKKSNLYPIDNLQVSYLNSNLPLYVLHITRDRSWSLVITPNNCFGWVKTADLTVVDEAFVERWERSKFVVFINDNKHVLDGITRISTMAPLVATTSSDYQVLAARKTDKGFATTEIVNVSKDDAARWPLSITPKNIAIQANKFMGKHYGWGGIYGLRDCSETMQALFAPFGIWLPRNSGAQAHAGKYISLDDYDENDTEKQIVKRGQPFLTLIWLPGHIMLYIGEKHGKAYAFHNPWRLHIKNSRGAMDGRAVIGHTVITTLDLGKEYAHNNWIYLNLIKGITLLAKPQY